MVAAALSGELVCHCVQRSDLYLQCRANQSVSVSRDLYLLCRANQSVGVSRYLYLLCQANQSVSVSRDVYYYSKCSVV